MSTKRESELLSKKVKSLIVEDEGKDSESLNKGHPWSVAKLLLLGNGQMFTQQLLNLILIVIDLWTF